MNYVMYIKLVIPTVVTEFTKYLAIKIIFSESIKKHSIITSKYIMKLYVHNAPIH